MKKRIIVYVLLITAPIMAMDKRYIPINIFPQNPIKFAPCLNPLLLQDQANLNMEQLSWYKELSESERINVLTFIVKSLEKNM